MAHIRHDFGSVRDVYEQLCKRLGHEAVAEVTGKSVSTVRRYCNPKGGRAVPLEDLKRLDRYLIVDLKQEPVFYEALAGVTDKQPRSVGAAAVGWMRAAG